MNYEQKYLKYKLKYLELKKILGGETIKTGDIEWNINPGQERNENNTISAKVMKSDGKNFIIYKGDCINYTSKSGRKQIGKVRRFLHDDLKSQPTHIEIYRRNYDSGEFDSVHKTRKFNDVLPRACP